MLRAFRVASLFAFEVCNEIKAPVYKQLLEMRRNVLDTVLDKDVAVWHST